MVEKKLPTGLMFYNRELKQWVNYEVKQWEPGKNWTRVGPFQLCHGPRITAIYGAVFTPSEEE